MSHEIHEQSKGGASVHGRARTLSAESLDGTLSASDATWLRTHFDACPDCVAVDAEYRANHAEMRALALPEPPRDLWARTSAALDAAASGSAQRTRVARLANRPIVWSAITIGVIVVVAAASMFGRGSLSPSPTAVTQAAIAVATTQASAVPSIGAQAPLAVVGGTSYWIASHAGVYEIKSGAAKCPPSHPTCSLAAGGGQTLGSVTSNTAVYAAIAPDATRAAVWTTGKIVVMPLGEQSATVSMALLTPRPTAVVPTPTPTSADEATPSPASDDSSEPSMEDTAAVTAAPQPTASPAPATEAIAVLSGYEIVGRDPQFSVDGEWLAFSARPVDHSTGPDVFVWRVGQDRAQRVTSRHRDTLAGWYGQRILISELSQGAGADPKSVGYVSDVYDPSTGTVSRIDRPMLLPVSDPTGKFVIYWTGTVEFDAASGLWVPGAGDLHFDIWSNLTFSTASLQDSESPEPTETAPTSDASPVASDLPGVEPDATAAASPIAGGTEPPVLPVVDKTGQVSRWTVCWDALGQHVAIWVADPGDSGVGRLSLFALDRVAGTVDTDNPLRETDGVVDGIGFDNGRLVYTSVTDGKTYMVDVPEANPTPEPTPTATLEQPTDTPQTAEPATPDPGQTAG